MKIHFIGVGERIMGDLAATLNQQGHTVTGSDISFAKATLHGLERAMLMPQQPGWFPEKIQPGLDKVIVGRQVHPDNPELKAAQQLGLPIYSYPEYIEDYAQDKQRIVIIGGEEKHWLCLLVVHTLGYLYQSFDYVVDSARLNTSVQLSDAPVIILEGDVDPSSSIDAQPQSLHYQHNIVVISGIDQENSSRYPTLEAYLEQVTKLADASPKGGTLIYYEGDPLIKTIGNPTRTDVKAVPYQNHPHRIEKNIVHLSTPQGDIPLQHTTAITCAVAGARQLLRNLAIQENSFYEALNTFSWQV